MPSFLPSSSFPCHTNIPMQKTKMLLFMAKLFLKA